MTDEMICDNCDILFPDRAIEEYHLDTDTTLDVIFGFQAAKFSCLVFFINNSTHLSILIFKRNTTTD